MAASCTRANFTRKCASYIHITESEPNLANRSPFAGETGTCRRNNRGSAEPSESKVDRVRGRVAYCAHANCITYFYATSQSVHAQPSAGGGKGGRLTSIKIDWWSWSTPSWTQLLVARSNWKKWFLRLDGSERQLQSITRVSGSDPCHLPLARPPSITTNPSPLRIIDWAVHSSVFRFSFAC